MLKIAVATRHFSAIFNIPFAGWQRENGLKNFALV
jgi:hypothetical protein